MTSTLGIMRTPRIANKLIVNNTVCQPRPELLLGFLRVVSKNFICNIETSTPTFSSYPRSKFQSSKQKKNEETCRNKETYFLFVLIRVNP